MTRLAFAGFVFASLSTFAACGSAQTPPAVAPTSAPAVAADNGQPKLQAALTALQSAQTELTAAEADKGGFRQQGLTLIQTAIDQVNQGMQYAASHANEAGEPEGAAEPEPVDDDVKGAGGQPHMAQTVVDLREARKQLRDAKHDKGGFRKQALETVQQAIDAVKKGIQFADKH